MYTIINIRMKIFIVSWFILQNIYLSRSEGDDSSIRDDNNTLGVIPDCIFGVESVTYVLYTRDQPRGKEVEVSDTYIPLRANKTVAFLIHGFISEANNSNYFELVTAWLEKEDINIFSLDWSNGACNGKFGFLDLLAYGSAVENIYAVATYLSNFVAKLVTEYGLQVNETIVVGHSLGAHLAGYSGKLVQNLIQQKYKQIIGLDPAGLLFENNDCDHRLCESDAEFIQVHHTSYLAGIHQAIGNVDFYFNEGVIQPGCASTACSHSRSVMYLTMSIRHSPCFLGTHWRFFPAFFLKWNQCEPRFCASPGLHLSEKTANGTYYVTTGLVQPYCNF